MNWAINNLSKIIKYVGFQISKDLKLHDQVCKADSIANRVLDMLKNRFVSRDPEIMRFMCWIQEIMRIF